MNTPATPVTKVLPHAQPAKLASLLALAGGAVALPQTGQADIIYTDLGANPGIVSFNSPAFNFTVPGTAQVGVFGAQRTVTTTLASIQIKYRSVLGGMINSAGAGAGVRGLANGNVQDAPFGAVWDQGVYTLANAAIASADDSAGLNPATGYNNRYLAWVFQDSTQGLALRYGWAEYNLSVAGFNAGGPVVTILRYAYDDSGLKPTMGQAPVPEPASGALLVMGALAMGSRGLRNWRQKRQTDQQA